MYPTSSRPRVRVIPRLVRAVGLLAGTAGLVGLGGVVALPAAQAGAPDHVRSCTNADLTASYHRTGEAMSHRYGRIVLKNTSSSRCRTGGYGGLSYVGDGDGTQIGAAADRSPGKVRSLVLRPGQRVISKVDAVIAQVYPRKKCHPAHVDGFRVYVPDATRSQYVEHATRGCRRHRVHLLSHAPYRRP